MSNLKLLALAFCVGLVWHPSRAQADEWNKETKLTFSGPVQVENTQLPAGTYVFKLADTADRRVVQIFNEDQTRVIATILAMPDYRVQPTGKTVVKFAETNNDEAEASGTLPENGIPIKEWFYPGDNFGHEFRVVQQPQVAPLEYVPTAPPAAATQPVEAVPAPAEPPVASEVPPTPQEREQTQAAVEPPAAPQAGPVPEELPQTAGSISLLSLMGILSLAAAASVHSIRKMFA